MTGVQTCALPICWGVAQYPYLLGTHLTVDEAAAPAPTLKVLVGVAVTAGVLILPSLVLLFRLAGRGRLGMSYDDVSH